MSLHKLSPLLVLLLLLVRPAAAQPPITVQSLPAQRGVLTEARTVIEAPAERVAALAGDPGVFVELYPAKQARVVGMRGKAQVVEVVMPAPWPVSQVRWTETVLSRMEAPTYIVDHEAVTGYFKQLRSIWRITPLGAARCEVVYRVAMEIGP